MTAFRSLARVVDERRQDAANQDAVTGGVFVVVGAVETVGMGESVIEVQFPVRFLEKPTFTWGMDLGDNPLVVNGAFPTASLVVGRWLLGIRAETGDRYYDGASLLGVTSGSQDTWPWFHYRFEGRALVGVGGRS